MASTFNIETLLKVQTFDFKHNISANFKAWICATHPEYIRTSLSNKIAPNDLNKFKDKYEYEKRKRDPTAPWHNFVQTLPKLIRETTEHAQQLDKEPLTLQQKYDALLKEHCDLVEKDSLSQRKILKITTQLQDTTLKYNAIKRDWNSYREDCRKEIDDFKKNVMSQRDDILVINRELEDTILQTRTELNHTRNSLYHYVAKTRTYEKQIQDLKHEKNQILQSFSDFKSHDLSTEALETLQTKYENPSSFIQSFSLTCPITRDTFIEPVIALDGRTYEKSAIEQWFNNSHKSPETGEKLPSTLLIPNMFARILIEELHNHNN